MEMPKYWENIRAGASIRPLRKRTLAERGQQIDVSLTILRLKTRSGSVTGRSTYSRDISDSKRVEKAFEHSATKQKDFVLRRRRNLRVDKQGN